MIKQKAVKLAARLERFGFDISEIYISPVLGEVPNSIDGISIPEYLDFLYRNEFGEINISYYHEEIPSTLLKEFGDTLDSKSIYGGPKIMSPDTILIELNRIKSVIEVCPERQDDPFWTEVIPFCWMSNGDYLCFNSAGEITYLAHDQDSFKLSNSFEDFWNFWQKVYFIGPEWWCLEPFSKSDGFIDLKSSSIKVFRKAFQLML